MIKIYFDGEELELRKSTYSENNAVYIGAYNSKGELYTDITTNVQTFNPFLDFESGVQYFNANGLHAQELKEVLVQENIIDLDECEMSIQSGFVLYQAYPFHRLEEMNSVEY